MDIGRVCSKDNQATGSITVQSASRVNDPHTYLKERRSCSEHEMTASVSRWRKAKFQGVVQACPAKLEQSTAASLLLQLLNELLVLFFNLALFHARVQRVCVVCAVQPESV